MPVLSVSGLPPLPPLCAVTSGVEVHTGKQTAKKMWGRKLIQFGLRTGQVRFSLHPDG